MALGIDTWYTLQVLREIDDTIGLRRCKYVGMIVLVVGTLYFYLEDGGKVREFRYGLLVLRTEPIVY